MKYVIFRRKDGDVDGFKSGITNLVRLSRCELQCGNGERRRRTCTSHNIDIITWLTHPQVIKITLYLYLKGTNRVATKIEERL